MKEDPGLMRRKTVCAYLGVDRHTLGRLVKADPAFPQFFCLTAGVEVIARADLLAWVEQKRLASRVAQLAP